MKLLSEDLIKEYGFIEDEIKSNKLIKIYSRKNFEIILKDNSFFFSNVGIDYPLSDLASLKKLYKENKKIDLTLV